MISFNVFQTGNNMWNITYVYVTDYYYCVACAFQSKTASFFGIGVELGILGHEK